MSSCTRFRDGLIEACAVFVEAFGGSCLNVMENQLCEMFPAGCIGTRRLILFKVYVIAGPKRRIACRNSAHDVLF
jgi:hypothetical protein